MANTVVKLYRSKKSKSGAWGTEPVSDKELKNLKDLPEGGGNYYLAYYEGNKRKMPSVGRFADMAKQKLVAQRRVQEAMGMGVMLPVDPVSDTLPEKAEIDAAITAYIKKISQPDKNGKFRPTKIIKSKESELLQFFHWSGKSFMKEIDAELMLKFRDKLLREQDATGAKMYSQTTVCNKLMIVTTFCKQNPLEPMPAPLPIDEFPDRRKTIPDPYTEKEFNDMLGKADYEAGLLIYTYASTGLRKQELANAEKEDIDFSLGNLHIREKESGWKGKNDSARRTVRLTDDLVAEFALRPSGLLFPAVNGGTAEHYDRIIEPIAKAAGVTPSTEKPHLDALKDDWIHRFRDTNITNRLHFCKGNAADLMDLCSEIGHANTKTLKSYYGKLKHPYEPKLRVHCG